MMGQNKTGKCGFGFFFRLKGPLISDWKIFSLHIFPSPDDLYKGEHTFFSQTVHQTEKVRPGYETKLFILDYISRRHFSIRCTVAILEGAQYDRARDYETTWPLKTAPTTRSGTVYWFVLCQKENPTDCLSLNKPIKVNLTKQFETPADFNHCKVARIILKIFRYRQGSYTHKHTAMYLTRVSATMQWWPKNAWQDSKRW